MRQKHLRRNPRQRTWRTAGLALLLVALLGLLAACGAGQQDLVELAQQGETPAAEAEAEQPAAEPAAPAEEPASAPADVAENQAPMLAERVAAGDLPPLAERLPTDPRVIEPLESIGTYGGTWRLGSARGPEPFGDHIGFESWMVFTPEGDIVPNILAALEGNEDATEYTLRLREGMKWSDGTPLTTADFAFWYESVLQNTDLTPTPPVWLASDGELATFTVIDDYTLTITFPQPSPFFTLQTALNFTRNVLKPAQYMQQFHADFADASALENELAAEGLDFWYELYDLRANPVINTDLPTLNAWMVTRGLGDGIESMSFERNPYYWKIDTEGNQLPYIDGVELTLVEDAEVLNLMALDGAFDWQEKDVARLDTLPLFYDNAERGDYRVFTMLEDNNNFAVYHPNYDHQDPVLRELIRDARFRQALSLAIDREAIVDLVHFGVTSPRQPAPFADTPFYSAEAENAFLAYDPDEANRLLDELGLTERNSDGIRLRSDGEPLRLAIQGPEGRQARLDASELVAQYWQDVGIQATTNVVSRELHQERRLARDFDVWLWSGPAGTTVGVLTRPGNYVPSYTGSDTAWAHGFAEWVQSGGEEGEQPPAEVQQAIDLYRQVTQTADQAEQILLMQQIVDIYAENLWVFGIAPRPPEHGVVKNSMRNVPDEMQGGIFSPARYQPESWYFAE